MQDSESQSDKSGNHKKCIQCKLWKPVRDFPYPRARMCDPCKRNSILGIMATVRTAPQVRLPAIDSTPELYNKWQRERARRLAADKPKREYKNPSKLRFCRRCKGSYKVELMATPTARLCWRCDGLTVEDPAHPRN